MPESYRKIDYRLRPAKSVERKMLAEAFWRLSKFARVDSYRYVGMGSIYFSDFILFHRLLGFHRMISIEKEDDLNKQKRFEFNSPFKSIQIEFGSTTEVLPILSWNGHNIVWLDYDGQLTKDVLNDVSLLSSQMKSGCLLLISVNAAFYNTPRFDDDGNRLSAIEYFNKSVGRGKVPAGTTAKDLTGWGMARVCRQIINNEIADTLNNRNLVLPPNKQVKYRQLFNFYYEDGAKMLTVGGILHTEEETSKFTECAFGELEFYRPSDDHYFISSPRLTFKEVRALNACLPIDGTPCEMPPVPEEERDGYISLYRYFPTFAEAEV